MLLRPVASGRSGDFVSQDESRLDKAIITIANPKPVLETGSRHGSSGFKRMKRGFSKNFKKRTRSKSAPNMDKIVTTITYFSEHSRLTKRLQNTIQCSQEANNNYAIWNYTS